MYQEKRRWQRFRADSPLKITVNGRHEIEGRCVKISAGGMCFFAVGNFTPGERISFEFLDRPTADPDRGQGTIRNRTVYLYGVEYDGSKVFPGDA